MRRIVIIGRRAIIGNIAMVQVSRRIEWCTEIFLRVVYDVEYLSGLVGNPRLGSVPATLKRPQG